jgi:uncharacterized protein YodC (DUF2158 family)
MKTKRDEHPMAEYGTLKIGDLVYLLSGGPLMTVTDIDSCGTVTCHWFVDDQLKVAEFPYSALAQDEASE